METMIAYGSYILLGAFAGLLSGLLGVGGGVIVVPGFLYIFSYQHFPNDLMMHMASGTSLAAMIVTTIFSLYAHIRRGVHFGNVLYYMIPGLVIGTSGGAVLAHFTQSSLLKILFGVLLITIALKDLLKLHFVPPKDKGEKSPPVFSIGGALIGLLSGIFGVGGGVLIIPFLEYCGIGMRQAVGTSLACGLVAAVTGTISFILAGWQQAGLPPLSLGYVYVPASIGVSISSPIFAFLGAWLNHHLRITVLKKLFDVFLLIVGLRLLL